MRKSDNRHLNLRISLPNRPCKKWYLNLCIHGQYKVKCSLFFWRKRSLQLNIFKWTCWKWGRNIPKNGSYQEKRDMQKEAVKFQRKNHKDSASRPMFCSWSNGLSRTAVSSILELNITDCSSHSLPNRYSITVQKCYVSQARGKEILNEKNRPKVKSKQSGWK